MKSRHGFVKFLSAIVMVMFLLQAVSCGTLLYPERRGQTGGRIDVGVAILDGIGLLLFIVPGLIAFAVDFATGAIYMTRGSKTSVKSPEADNMVVIRVNPEKLNRQSIEEIVSNQTGYPIILDQRNLKIFESDASENIETQLSKLAKSYRVVR